MGARAPLAQVGLLCLGLLDTLGQDLGVLVLLYVSDEHFDRQREKEIRTASSLTFSFWRRFREIR